MNDQTQLLNDQRGVALPMAMLALLILSALVLGFSVLSATEPTIANNQLMVAQARSLGEAGVERAIWALNFGLTDPNGIPPSLAGPASAPYDGSQLALVSIGATPMGGFRVTVCALSTTTTANFAQPASGGSVTVSVGSTACMTVGQSVLVQGGGSYTVSSIPGPTIAVLANSGYAGNAAPGTSIPGGSTVGGKLERLITAVGWVPNDTTATPKAHQKITVTVVGPPALPAPPAALSVRGELQMGGTSLIDSRSDTTPPGTPGCSGPKLGTLTTGDTSINGAAKVWGATDTIAPGTPNNITDAGGGSVPANAQDGVKNASPSAAFDPYALTDTDIVGLRAYAKAHGMYLQGTVEFCASCLLPNGQPALLPNGLVFIDTVSGTNITQEGVTPPTPSSDFADVTIHGNPTVDPSGIFSGWLFVNGSLRIDGEFTAHGLVYAQNDIIYRGIGNAAISGAVMSRNIRDLSSTSIDSDSSGNARVIYNCAWAKNGGGMLQTFAMQPGTYKEVSD